MSAIPSGFTICPPLPPPKARRIGAALPTLTAPAIPHKVYWSDAISPLPIKTLAQVEREHVEAAMRANGYSVKRSARQLGIGVRTLQLKLRGWGHPPRWKGT